MNEFDILLAKIEQVRKEQANLAIAILSLLYTAHAGYEPDNSVARATEFVNKVQATSASR